MSDLKKRLEEIESEICELMVARDMAGDAGDTARCHEIDLEIETLEADEKRLQKQLEAES